MAITPGEILRNKREELKLSLEQVADGTNIRIHFLQAIEENRSGAISSQAQLRGFIRLYASYLGLQPQDLLESPTPKQDTPGKVHVEEDTFLAKPSVKLVTEPIDEKPKRKVTPRSSAKKIVKEEIPEKKSILLFREIGTELQRQREALGLSRNDIERQIKIRELYIFALENGQVDDLPSTVQGRGMLNNYAAFMSLDPEPLQMQFAEGLQQRRLEKVAEEAEAKKNPGIRKHSAPITGWRKYITPDILIGGSVFTVLFILIIWGALQVIGSSRSQINPTTDPISSVLIATETPTLTTELATNEIELTATPTIDGGAGTASVDLLATITAIGNNPIQIVVVAHQRAFLKVITDGKEVFTGRTVPGGVYPFTGSSRITLTSGNAAALQIYYNQRDLGILGGMGQLLNLDFTRDDMVTVTPQFTAFPTNTPLPTMTQLPTPTPTITNTPVAPTITPFRP